MVENRPNMQRRPALAEIDPARVSGLSPDTLAIRLLPPRARFSLRVDPALLPAGGRVADFSLDVAVNRRTATATRTAMRLGPNEWLLRAAESEAAQVAGDVGAALAGRHFSLVDVSHSRIGLAVSGARAAQTMNAGCPLDLSPVGFPVGMATRTLLGKCEVILAKTDEQPAFEIECGRSFASYLRDFLLEAARGFPLPMPLQAWGGGES
jgi:sarcosine oxidase, subunit gamma